MSEINMSGISVTILLQILFNSVIINVKVNYEIKL